MGEGQTLLEPMGLGSLVRGDQALLQAEPEELMCAPGALPCWDTAASVILAVSSCFCGVLQVGPGF